MKTVVDSAHRYCYLSIISCKFVDLSNIDLEIVESEFQCFFFKLQGFPCLTNLIRLPCCSPFYQKTCQNTWAKSWKKCGHCRFPFKNIEEHDVEIKDSLTSTADQDHPENVTSSPDKAPPVMPASHIRQNARTVHGAERLNQ